MTATTANLGYVTRTEPLPPLRLNAVGDLYFGRRVQHEAGMAAVRDVLQDAHATFANVEMLFHRFGSAPQPEFGGTWSASPWEFADQLPWLGVNLAALPTNHVGDYGVGGIVDQLDAMKSMGIAHAGLGRTLAEARRPAYLDTPAGRIALVAACSTFHESARAGHQRRDNHGRPGLNPLRFSTTYRVDRSAMEALRRIADGLELKARKEHRIWGFHHIWEIPGQDATLSFLRERFAEGEGFAIESQPHPGDLEEHQAIIAEARRQADRVVVSLHSHEFDTVKAEPPGFMVEFAHACIDAGADAFLGHGAHLLRGVEMYRGRPILYGLGNFIIHINMFPTQPDEAYEAFAMPPKATPADLYDRRSSKDTTGFFADPRYWVSVIAQLELGDAQPAKVRLVPMELGMGLPRSRRGSPRIAEPELGRRIIAEVARLSEPFGTAVEWDGEAGVVRARGTSRPEGA